MPPSNDDSSRLTSRDEELVALGAAIASNCIPCVEYHIPQARKTGLNDLQIRAAVELADKVRRVPAEKVLQTAFALLERHQSTRTRSEAAACGCAQAASGSRGGAAGVDVAPGTPDAILDHGIPQEDNRGKSAGEDTEGSGSARGSGRTEAASPGAPDPIVLPFSKMMEMMQHCCPDKMKDFASRMYGSGRRSAAPEEESGS